MFEEGRKGDPNTESTRIPQFESVSRPVKMGAGIRDLGKILDLQVCWPRGYVKYGYQGGLGSVAAGSLPLDLGVTYTWPTATFWRLHQEVGCGWSTEEGFNPRDGPIQ